MALPHLAASGGRRVAGRLLLAIQLTGTALAGILVGVIVTHALVRPNPPDPASAAPLTAPARTAPTIFRVESPTPPPVPTATAGPSQPSAGAAAPGPAPTSPTPAGAAAPSAGAKISRLLIPAIDVDAPVAPAGIDAHQVMEAPEGPEGVVWYDFSARPGAGGNAVFAGHLDFAGHGPAVFWRLRDLAPGDRILVAFDDGSALAYRVTDKSLYNDASAPVDRIIAPTRTDQLTLITCAGLFNRAIGRYDDRLIVHAERV